MRNKKMGFIGAGKVCIGLGNYFKSNGCNIIGCYSRNPESAKDAANVLKASAFTDLSKLAEVCDIIFITTPDSQIINVWNELKKCNIKNKIICHTSGALSSEVFIGKESFEVCTYSIHPMYAFSDRTGKSEGLESACFTIEGDNTYLEELQSFISSMGNKALIIETDKKVLYHIANVMASNLALALFLIADECIQESGISCENSIRSLMPLILGNIKNISKNGFINSLTGPIERNDIHTIQEHLKAVPEQYGIVYAELSKILTQLAAKKHSDRNYEILNSQLNDYIARRSLN